MGWQDGDAAGALFGALWHRRRSRFCGGQQPLGVGGTRPHRAAVGCAHRAEHRRLSRPQRRDLRGSVCAQWHPSSDGELRSDCAHLGCARRNAASDLAGAYPARGGSCVFPGWNKNSDGQLRSHSATLAVARRQRGRCADRSPASGQLRVVFARRQVHCHREQRRRYPNLGWLYGQAGAGACRTQCCSVCAGVSSRWKAIGQWRLRRSAPLVGHPNRSRAACGQRAG